MPVYKYGLTNGQGTTLAADLGVADPTLTTIGGMSGADGALRYNVVIGAEIIGVTDCSSTTWTILERGV